MASVNSVAFGRVGVFWLFLKAMDDYYGDCISNANLPDSLLNDHMRLMPLTEMTRYLGLIEEQVDDELFIAKAGANIQLQNFIPLHNIVCSAPVLFTALIRFNALFKTLQSDSEVKAVRSGNILKWSYNTESFVAQERLQDGIFCTWLYLHLLRHYLGEQYSPISIHLPGSRLGKAGEVDAIFGCDVVWNAKQTEIWCSIDALEQHIVNKPKVITTARINQLQVIDYINIPDENDFARCVYELINYARAFGYPKLEFIAEMMMISPLTLQRRLQKEQYSFSELVKYQLLYNLAPQMLQEGLLIEKVGEELGFNNPQSFFRF